MRRAKEIATGDSGSGSGSGTGNNSDSDALVGAQPFLKWAGGKWAIAPRIAAHLPKDVRQRVYREPFLGGGAMFFYLEPERAILSDAVADLISTYQVVQTN